MTHRPRPARIAAAAAAAALFLTACGGNLGGQSAEEAAENFPSGPINLTVGQDPGGSTDLIARALATPVSDELGVPMPVINRPGANGGVAAEELAGQEPNGQELMVINLSLTSITPLAVPENQAIDIADYEVITGVSQDDYVLVANADSGLTSVEDMQAADGPLDYATTGVGTGSQLSTELLFQLAEIPGRAVPFDGGSPALTAVLGNQVDVTSIQLGEAMPQIEAGAIVPLVTFSAERNDFMPDVPTAVESGFDVEVAQARAIVAPAGTPDAIVERLREAFETAYETEAYQAFNEDNLLTPTQTSGEETQAAWEEALASYERLVEEYDIDLGGER